MDWNGSVVRRTSGFMPNKIGDVGCKPLGIIWGGPVPAKCSEL